MSHRSILLAGGVLIISMVSAACGGSSATPTPAPAAASVAPGGAAGVPSAHPDADLASLFPKTVGGAPMTVTTRSGSDLTSQAGNSEAAQAQIQAFLTSQNKTIADLSIGFGGGSTAEGQAYAVEAFRLKGADANAMLTALLPIFANSVESAQTSQVQVAGKTVTLVSNGSASASGQPASYLYPKNDVVWIVSATDPTLTEIIQNLP